MAKFKSKITVIGRFAPGEIGKALADYGYEHAKRSLQESQDGTTKKPLTRQTKQKSRN